MKNGKKKRSKKAEISISENIIVPEKISSNSLLLDDIDFLSRTLALDADRSERLIDAIKDKLDNLSELGEMESLRLQIILDRLSKFMQILANIVKKISDTESAIVQNLR